MNLYPETSDFKARFERRRRSGSIVSVSYDENIRAFASFRATLLMCSSTVDQLVRDYLAGLVREADRRPSALTQIDEIFHTIRVEVGRRSWRRQDLHQR